MFIFATRLEAREKDLRDYWGRPRIVSSSSMLFTFWFDIWWSVFRAYFDYKFPQNNKCFLELESAGSARQHSWPMIHLTADASRVGEIPESTTYLAGWAMNLIWKPFRTIGFCGYWIPMLSTVTVQKERKSSVDRGGILNYTASRRCVMNKEPENIISTGRTYFPFPERNNLNENSPCNYKEFNVITF